MSSEARKWLFFPLGAIRGRDRTKLGRRPDIGASGGDGGIDAISKKKRAVDFSNMNEEDAVEDYNAPM
jgi:hypothetical protein